LLFKAAERGKLEVQCVARNLDFWKCKVRKQVPFFTQSTNPRPLNFINHHLFACNSGVSWGSQIQQVSAAGKARPLSGANNSTKIQPLNRLATFKFHKLSFVCLHLRVEKPGGKLQNFDSSPPSPPVPPPPRWAPLSTLNCTPATTP